MPAWDLYHIRSGSHICTGEFRITLSRGKTEGMSGGEDKPANRRQDDSQDPANRLVEEMLRQIGIDILDEPVPERLRRVLRPKGGSDGGNTADERTQRRDDEPSR